MLVSWLSLWPSISAASPRADLPARFKACAPYEADIADAVRRRWRRDFQFPAVWRAQLYQESLCDPSAISHAGAGGIAQFMPATAREMAERLGFDFDRYDAQQAIDAGAYYQARVMRTWRGRGRTPEDAYDLGAASYNAGTGNILRAQKRCANALRWADIHPCLPDVTGRHARETRTYVERIHRWTNEAEADRPWNVPPAWRAAWTGERREFLRERHDIRRVFTGQSWCTYSRVGGGWMTACHCDREAEAAGHTPGFLDGLDGGCEPGFDIALYGESPGDTPPPRIQAGDIVETVGFPAGADRPAYRRGRAYLRREPGEGEWPEGRWIVALPAGPRATFEREPVVGGQSGSPGMVEGETVCALATQNSPADLDRDRRADHSFDCIGLAELWEARHARTGDTP